MAASGLTVIYQGKVIQDDDQIILATHLHTQRLRMHMDEVNTALDALKSDTDDLLADLAAMLQIEPFDKEAALAKIAALRADIQGADVQVEAETGVHTDPVPPGPESPAEPPPPGA